tara:strand:- start:222 stop:449 length:228 start_codon:yes stop_codon:yes gene_type:complete
MNLIKAQIKALPRGTKFTLHPQSRTFWIKGTEELKPDGTVRSIKGTHAFGVSLWPNRTYGGECWYDPKHIVWAMS